RRRAARDPRGDGREDTPDTGRFHRVLSRMVAGCPGGEADHGGSLGPAAQDRRAGVLRPHVVAVREFQAGRRRSRRPHSQCGCARSRRAMMVYLITAAAVVVYLILAWLLGSILGLKSPDIWILRGGLALIGVAGAAVFLWYWVRKEREKKALGAQV